MKKNKKRDGFRGILITSPSAEQRNLSEPLARLIGEKLNTEPLPVISTGRLLSQAPEKLRSTGVPAEVADRISELVSSGTKCARGDVHIVLRAALQEKRDWLMTGFPVCEDDLLFMADNETQPSGMVIVTSEETSLFDRLLQPWKKGTRVPSPWFDRHCPTFPGVDPPLTGKAEVLRRRIHDFAENVMPILQRLERDRRFPVTWVSASYVPPDDTLQLVAHAFGF